MRIILHIHPFYIFQGLKIYIDFVDHPMHYVTRISRSNEFTVPNDIENVVQDLLPLLSALLSLKLMILKTVKLLSRAEEPTINLKSSLKRAFDDTDDYDQIMLKIVCATTPEDNNGRFRKMKK